MDYERDPEQEQETTPGSDKSIIDDLDVNNVDDTTTLEDTE